MPLAPGKYRSWYKSQRSFLSLPLFSLLLTYHSGIISYPQTPTMFWILKTFNFTHFTAKFCHSHHPGANTAWVHYGKALSSSETSAFGCCFRENEKPDACLSVGVTSFVNLLSIFLIVSFLITHIKKSKKWEPLHCSSMMPIPAPQK